MSQATIPIDDRLEEKTALTLYTNYLIYAYLQFSKKCMNIEQSSVLMFYV